MRWRPHTERPATADPALIVVRQPRTGLPFVLPELYRFHASDELWFGAANVLLLKHEVFHWLPEAELLRTLP